MYGLSLFSGIGGIDVALSEYVQPSAYCEIDPYCQSILLQNMQKGYLSKAPIWDDIRTLSAKEIPVDIVYGGFPCQDVSIAGLKKGLEGERSGLVFEIFRLLDETKASFLFLENVPNIRTKGAERICKELAERRYDCRWCCLSASDVGAVHKRERWFLLAHAPSPKCAGLSCRKAQKYTATRGLCKYSRGNKWKKDVSSICRITNGIPNRLHRIKALGNAVVPIQAKIAFEILLKGKRIETCIYLKPKPKKT